LAFASGDAEAAVPLLEAAAATFRRVEYRDDEWRTRRVLADAFASLDRQDAAERELRQVRLEAQEHGHVAEARRAGEALAARGAAGRPTEAARASRRKRSTQPAAEPATAGGPSTKMGNSRPTEVVATVMFLDVRGYTEQTARRPPQDTVDRLSSLHRWAKQEVERHHGAVDKFAGDAVMAVFNASGARLDHAVHALQAALAIRDKAAYAGMPVGIGLATGPAVVGQLVEGSNVSAVGESTNLAARLQSAASAGEILLSEETYRRVKDWLSTRGLEAGPEDFQLKGFDHPIGAFRLG
jgi:class 3 adenylate cyclase